LESFDHIQLDEEDLRRAREKKHYRLEREKYRESLKEMKPAKLFTAEAYYKAFTQIFPINEAKEREYSVIVKSLCCYFANDPRFETRDLKLSKGILLFGSVGVGKTTLMQMFKINGVFSYKMVSCREVESEYAKEGDVAIGQYSINYPSIAINSNPFGHQELGYCFDDLGTENAVTKHFGNAKNVMADILLNRYDNAMTKARDTGNPPEFRDTHITTNLSAEEIEKYYGTRVRDRMRECFNMITFDEKSQSRRS
jgi:energy-coupling factor transporter ATP-binding protein EcfA2